MADSTTQHRNGNEVRTDGDVPARRDRDERTRGLASLLAGAAGVVVAILPGLAVVALGLAGVGIVIGVPAMRRGPGTAGFPFARTGVVLAMIAVLLGFVSLAMQLLS